MHCPRLVWHRKVLSEQRYPIQRSTLESSSITDISLNSLAFSIPHASSPNNGHNGPHQPLSISPTNSTSPVNRESGLAHDENTQVPQDVQISSSEGEAQETEVEADQVETNEAQTEETV